MNVTDRILGEAMTPWQRRIYKDPEKACVWAEHNSKRFPEAEPYIAKSPEWAYYYAVNVIRGRFPEAEAIIAKVPYWSYNYVVDVIRGRWPEGESTIAKTPGEAYYYAMYVIEGRWPEAEATIAKDPKWAYNYADDVIRGRWPEGEAAIAQSKWKHDYLEKFPDAKDDWILKGWLDWLDT